MKIKLTPVRMDEQLTASVLGDVVILNDKEFDFSPLQEGDSISSDAIQSNFIIGTIYRKNGIINITLVLPHGADAPHETRFPEAYTNPINISYGDIQLPPYNAIKGYIE